MTPLERLVAGLRQRNATLATAESVTGGLVGAALTETPGSSTIYRGGVVVYATDLKATLAGVPVGLLARAGPIHPDTAAAMAIGVRDRLRTTYGLATTGVAGPEAQDGHRVGEVYVAAAGPDGVRVRRLSLSGDRRAIRTAAVQEVILLGAAVVCGDADPPAENDPARHGLDTSDGS